MPSFVNGVRSEFTVSDIEYSRDGGWFLTYKKAALLTILVMSLCLFSAYMGRQSTDHVVYVQVSASPKITYLQFQYFSIRISLFSQGLSVLTQKSNISTRRSLSFISLRQFRAKSSDFIGNYKLYQCKLRCSGDAAIF